MKINKRKGKVLISKEFLDKRDNHVLSLLFKQFYPYAIDNTFANWNQNSTYFGYSPRFEEIEPGSLIPEYRAIFTTDEKGKTTIEFKKID